MHTIAFPLIYLMVALNPATGQWEAYNSFVFPDQKTCLENRQAWGDAVLGDAGNYFCLAYKEPRYMNGNSTKGPLAPPFRVGGCPTAPGMEWTIKTTPARKRALQRVRRVSRMADYIAVCRTAFPMSTRMIRPLGRSSFGTCPASVHPGAAVGFAHEPTA